MGNAKLGKKEESMTKIFNKKILILGILVLVFAGILLFLNAITFSFE